MAFYLNLYPIQSFLIGGRLSSPPIFTALVLKVKLYGEFRRSGRSVVWNGGSLRHCCMKLEMIWIGCYASAPLPQAPQHRTPEKVFPLLYTIIAAIMDIPPRRPPRRAQWLHCPESCSLKFRISPLGRFWAVAKNRTRRDRTRTARFAVLPSPHPASARIGATR